MQNGQDMTDDWTVMQKRQSFYGSKGIDVGVGPTFGRWSRANVVYPSQ